MSQALRVPDEVYHSLTQYASARHQTVEEALADLLSKALSEGAAAPSQAAGGATNPEAETSQSRISNGPWEGLFGTFESPYSDLVARHDYYIGKGALEIHEHEDRDADDTQP